MRLLAFSCKFPKRQAETVSRSYPDSIGNLSTIRHSGRQTSSPGREMLDPQKLRDNPIAIAEYLTEAFEKSELSGILDAIKSVMQAQNVKQLAEITGMRRDGLYKTFATKRILNLAE